MADTPQDIQLRRFVRPIGVTGLGTAPLPGRTERRLGTLGDSFDGVLAAGVSADPGTPPADLSYLTLAPLVAQGLARGERNGGADPTSGAESIPGDGDDDSGSTAPGGDELRVRELLRDDDVSSSERDPRLTGVTVSEGPPRTISDEGDEDDESRSAGRSARTDRSDRGSSLSGRDERDGHRGGDGPADVSDWDPERGGTEPPRTVVEQSAHDVDIPGTDRDSSGRDTSRRDRRSERPVPSPPDGPGPTQGSDTPPRRGPSDAVPTTVVHRGTPPGEGRGGPALTVTGPGTTEVAAESDADPVSGANGTERQSRVSGSPGEQSGVEAVADRTVIRSDGRLNERVFDRLYEEVSRKMRLERDREGR